jgi:hypothetical protein
LLSTGNKLGRVLLLVCGAIAAGWGGLVLPSLWHESTIGRVANRIIEGQPFKADALNRFLPDIAAIADDQDCRPSALRSVAIFRLRMSEDAISAGEQQLIDSSLQDLDQSVRKSLACAPSDSFLWLVLFWVENTRNGFKQQNVALLDMSYRLSAHEAWIGLIRVPMAAAVLQQLPAELKDAVVTEFIGLLDSGYYPQMATVFPKLGAETSAVVLARLKSASPRNREAFARELYRRGYNVSVPGVTPVDPRPWH